MCYAVGADTQEDGVRMGVLYNASIANHGSDSLSSGDQILYAALHFTTLPSSRRLINLYDDHSLRMGYITFGDTVSVGAFTGACWRSPIWLDFTSVLWTPDPSGNSSTPLGLYASLVRWDLGDGVADLFVYGA